MAYSGLKYLVVGSGLWGAVFAEQIASVLGEKVLVIDKRSHWGGNSYSQIDAKTGIEYHKYGTHIFHTSNKRVWDYLNQFTAFNSYRHKVLITCKDKVYFMPINLSTINSFYGLNLTPSEAQIFIQEEIKKANITNPQNLEEKAISLIGKPLYEAFIKGYTQKQWETEPKNLPSEIITRLPVRTDYNVNYFSDKYEGIPTNGYGEMIKKILSHPNIELKLNTDFYDIKAQLPTDCKIIYTGMLDKLFDYKFGALDWRSLDFEWQTHNVADFQGTSVMNYGDTKIPYTRIHEFKHLHPERQEIFNKNQTVISLEYPKTFKKGDIPYYPINDERNSKLYNLYKQEIEKNPTFIIGGRLGAYKYWDMDKAIENSLETFDSLHTKGVI